MTTRDRSKSSGGSKSAGHSAQKSTQEQHRTGPWRTLRWPLLLVIGLGCLLLLCLVNLLTSNQAIQDIIPTLKAVDASTIKSQPMFVESADSTRTEVAVPITARTHAELLALHDRLATQVDSSRFWTLMSLAAGAANLLALAWLGWAWSQSETDRSARVRGQEQAVQAAILLLLNEMSPVAKGDLTSKATVGEALTGALADAFNHAISEIRWLVSTIDSSATAVAHSVERSQGTARSMSRACNAQASEIHHSSNYLTSMSGAMTELAKLAAESSGNASQTVQSAQLGADALERSLKSLRDARVSAEGTLQLMLRLAENADSIDAHAAAVREVTRRTDLLALNSTIQVVAASSQEAMAVDPGEDGLARLAGEVQELADILGTATREISAVTDTVGRDIDITIDAMQRTRQVLLAGIDDTALASQRLKVIDRLARALQQQVVDMASGTVKQTAVLRKLGDNMSIINDLTRQTAGQVHLNVEELDQLYELASDLRASVAGFKLPVTDSNGVVINAESAVKAARRAASEPRGVGQTSSSKVIVEKETPHV